MAICVQFDNISTAFMRETCSVGRLGPGARGRNLCELPWISATRNVRQRITETIAETLLLWMCHSEVLDKLDDYNWL